ncbi:hypothetical protein [Micromonospora sp. CPCC 206061]|uniref:hypothetical protein n=1 Tax=Micromonospora sp. CPCC 206061 TaxID=3122410 RepID=UPI002FF02007
MATVVALVAGASFAAAAPASASDVSAAVDCGNIPGGGWSYYATTLDSTPVRVGPYEACSRSRTAAAGSRIRVNCYLYNDYGNLWYKVEESKFVYSSHFSSSVKNQVGVC